MSNVSVFYAALQLITGIGAAVLVFFGIKSSVVKLNPEDRTREIPVDVIYKSTRLIILGLLLYTLTKTVTFHTNSMGTETEADWLSCFGAALVSVVKTFGFIALFPLILNYIRTTHYKHHSERTEKSDKL